MELWQQLGHASFGDWRRASEKARRAAKKAARVVPPPAAAVRWAQPKLAEQSPSLPAAVLPPARPPLPTLPLPLARPPSPTLPREGWLREDVLVTPQGRRRHCFQHTSPGGSIYFGEYVSPAGVQQQACEQRQKCMRELTATRHAELRAHVFGCGECEACQEYALSRDSEMSVRPNGTTYFRHGRKPVVEMKPFKIKRSRRNYPECCVSLHL